MATINYKPTEYIEFMDFNSKSEGLFLISRDAPTPSEKNIVKNLPYRQGNLDFSMLLGERVFENRELTFKFILPDMEYQKRKLMEIKIKRQLMRHGNNRLYDSAIQGYYWLGKCESVSIEHDYQYNKFVAEIVFDCYPYMFYAEDYFTDIFDDFDLEYGIAGYTKFAVKDNLQTTISNSGTISVKPDIICDSNFKATLNGESFEFKEGKNKNHHFSLKPGTNELVISGNGTFWLRYHIEVMG